MKPLQFLVDAFVNTFGITRPTPQQEKRAGVFIAGMLLLIVCLLGCGIWVVRSVLAR